PLARLSTLFDISTDQFRDGAEVTENQLVFDAPLDPVLDTQLLLYIGAAEEHGAAGPAHQPAEKVIRLDDDGIGPVVVSNNCGRKPRIAPADNNDVDHSVPSAGDRCQCHVHLRAAY